MRRRGRRPGLGRAEAPAPSQLIPDRVLFICTGNICRSPLAAAILRQRLRGTGLVGVASAGLVTEGRPAHDRTLLTATELGLDLSAHRSRRLTDSIVRRADLVIGMERQHVREAVVLQPEVLPVAFTLRSLAGLARQAGPRPPDAELEDWLYDLSYDRDPAELLGDDPADAVADPMGKDLDAFRRCATELDELVTDTADLLWPT